MKNRGIRIKNRCLIYIPFNKMKKKLDFYLKIRYNHSQRFFIFYEKG